MATTLAQQRSLFVCPDEQYRPVPWWMWTGRMKEPEMRHQLDLMREHGIYEFFIFPIYGMETPYCSDDYFRQVRFTLEHCRRHGMKAWIYDEYTWPSGVCAGFVLRDHPWSRQRSLKWAVREAQAPGETIEIPYEGDLVAARAITADGRVNELSAPAPGEPISYAGEPATVAVFSIAVSHLRLPYAAGADWLPQEESYVDVLNPAAMAKFIEYTHERYVRHAGEYFPATVPGFFTDEPGLYEMFPYTGDLCDAFRRHCGYDLRPRLHELVLDVGDYRRTRYHYWCLVSERLGEAYHRQIREWCNRHQVHYTGHLPGEETLWEVLRYNGDIWEASRWMSIPGIDMLVTMTGFGSSQPTHFYSGVDTRSFHTTVKLIASTCRHTGAKRMLSEAFSVSTFGLTAAEMRWGANWQAALGVNLFNDSAFQYTIAGFRKWMVCGKHFTTPWFQRYQVFSDYCARLCRLHAEGEPAAEVAVLYPRTATFCLANERVLRSTGRDDAQWQVMQQAVTAVTDALVRWQWDFDFLYEQLLEQATLDGDALAVGDARYRVVILPAAVALPGAVVRKLSEFARAGGLILAVSSPPAYCPDAAADPSSELRSLETVALDAQLPERLDALLGGVLQHPLRLTGDRARMVVSSRRRYPDGDVFFLANMDSESVEVKAEIGGGPACEVWDPDRGAIFAAEAILADKGCRVKLELAPGQGIFLCPRAHTDAAPWYPRVLGEQKLDDEWRFSASPGNLLRLAPEVRFDPENRGESERWYELDAPGEWLPTRDSLLPTDLIVEETPQYWMRARVFCSAPLRDVRLVVDSTEVTAAYLDGQKLPDPAPFTLWDQENRAYSLPALDAGEHLVALRARTSKYHSPRIRGILDWPLNALDPAVLLGDFSVERSEPIQAIGSRQTDVRTGDWTSQGYPFFAGVGEYRQTARLPQQRGRVWLDLGNCRDVLEVEVNGEQVGARPWPPYRIEVTDAVRPGDNEIVIRVFSTLGNLLWEHYSHAPRRTLPSGLLGPCRLVWTE